MNKYHSAMEKIIVTPEMEERILRNLSSKKKPINELKKHSNIRWIMYAGAVAACLVIGLCVIFSYPLLTDFNDGVQLNYAISSFSSKNIGTHSQNHPPKVSEPAVTAPATVSQPERSSVHESAAVSSSRRSSSRSSTLLTCNWVRTSSHPKMPHHHESKPNRNSEKPNASSSEQTNSSSSDGRVSSANPLINTSDIDELKEIVPFKLSVPGKIPSTYKISSTSLISGKLAQIIYSDGSNTITYREAIESEDISCDPSSYDENSTITVGDIQVILQGSNSLINSATWTNNGCSCSLYFSAGMEKEDVITIIESMELA